MGQNVPITIDFGPGLGGFGRLGVDVIGVDSSAHNAYVTTIDGTMSAIDGTLNRVVTSFPLCDSCTIASKTIAVDPLSHTLYIATGSGVVLIDGPGRRVITTIALPAPDFPLNGLALDLPLHRAYVATGFGPLRVIDTATRQVIAQVDVGPGSADVGVDEATHVVYVVDNERGRVWTIDGKTLTVVAIVPVGHAPDVIGVDSVTNTAYVGNWSDQTDQTVSVIDGHESTVVASVFIGESPRAVTVDPTTHRVYVAAGTDDSTAGHVYVIAGRE